MEICSIRQQDDEPAEGQDGGRTWIWMHLKRGGVSQKLKYTHQLTSSRDASGSDCTTTSTPTRANDRTREV